MRSSFLRRVGGRDPIIFMIGALLCAAALVIYLQQRALRALDRQTQLILHKMAEEKASSVVQSLRRTFEGPVFDTLSSIKHPDLVDHRVDIVLATFAEGLRRYPHVERFFIWTEADDPTRPGVVRFFDREALTTFRETSPSEALLRSDRVSSETIVRTAYRHAQKQMIYGAYRTGSGATEVDEFLRIFYTDATRTRFYAVLGFSVNMEATRRRLFPTLMDHGLRDLLSSHDLPTFSLRVHDEHGALIFGDGGPLPAVAVERTFPLLFYPADDILTRMAASLPSRPWKVIVTQDADAISALSVYTGWRSYGLLGLSVALICVALAFALQARARAAELSRMQTDFVAHVSHQLKTPVSLLSAVTETLDVVRARSPEKLDQCLDILKMETGRLSTLVQHILQFSSLSNGVRRFEPEVVALGPLVRETVESFAAALAPNGFRIEVEERASPLVAADPVALEQAVVNLLDNAIKYSGTSRLVTVRLASHQGRATIEIIDRGIGIAAADHARIFERFFRGSGSSSRSQGFGLGLAIARELVTGQRGTLEFESRPGEGSTFRISLPLFDARQQAPADDKRLLTRWSTAETSRDGVHAETEA